MEFDKRTFMKIFGLALLGFGVKPVSLLAQQTGSRDIPDPGAMGGKRWAMVIDPKRCLQRGKDGCTDCMDACHKIHNVPRFENHMHEIKWIWKEPYENAFPGQHHEYVEHALEHKPVIVLCNHCANPPCVRVCPTKATFKREDGIVIMDMHRCIGCRFCMAACPYGSRSFNWMDPRRGLKTEEINQEFPTRSKGVVEKCNFCAERLAVGLMPACVEACKVNAMVFGDVEDPRSEIRKILNSNYTIRRKPNLGTEPQVYYIV